MRPRWAGTHGRNKKLPNCVTTHVPIGEKPNVTRHMVPAAFALNSDWRTDVQKMSAEGHGKDSYSGTWGGSKDHYTREWSKGPEDPKVLFALMCEEFEECSEMQLSQVDVLSDCVYVCSSDCEVLPVPKILRTIQVPGPNETLSVQSDEQLCLASNNEQEKRASRPK